MDEMNILVGTRPLFALGFTQINDDNFAALSTESVNNCGSKAVRSSCDIVDQYNFEESKGRSEPVTSITLEAWPTSA